MSGQLADSPFIDQIMPKPKLPRKPLNPLVAALVYDGLCVFEFSCAAEVFGLPRPEFGADWYRFETCAVGRRRVRSQYGLIMESDGGADRLAQAGTIIVPGWRGADEPVPAAVIDPRRAWRAARACCRSVPGLRAGGDRLARRQARDHALALCRCPAQPVSAHPGRCGRAVCGRGAAADVGGQRGGPGSVLHLLRRDYGPARANQVARRLVIPPHREGGQAQFVESPVDQEEGGSLAPVLDALRAYRPALADRRSGRERRHERAHVPRRFQAATGMTPADWIVRARLDIARELLERTGLSIEQIATRTGLGTAMTMRHHFRRKMGVSPTEYRRQFGQREGVAVA